MESKSSAGSKGSLSVESKSSFETESSSGSLGAAQRRGNLQQKEQQSTFKAFNVESSSSSLDENWVQMDECEGKQIEDIALSSSSSGEKKNSSPDDQKESDSSVQDDLNDGNYGYSSTSSSMSTQNETVAYGTGFTLNRTLSRISERSTASEKSSGEDDLRSVEGESVHEESIASSDRQGSISSDSRSNTNFAYISDGDRRTSAEMPEIPCDSQLSERLAEMYGLDDANTVKNGRFCITNVEEGAGRVCASKRGMINASAANANATDRPTLDCISNAGSQDSEDFPLPDIPYDNMPMEHEPTLETHIKIFDQTMQQRTLPKTFCWKTSTSIQSNDSERWPSPPMSPDHDADTPVVAEVEAFYADAPEYSSQVMVDSFTDTTVTPTTAQPNGSDIEDDISQMADISKDQSIKSDKNLETPIISPIVEQPTMRHDSTSYLPQSPPTCESKHAFNDPYEPKSCFASTLSSASCLRSSGSCCKSHKSNTGLMKDQFDADKVIVSQPTRSSPPQPLELAFDDEPFVVNDDVFSPGTVQMATSPDDTKFTEYFNRKFSRSSNNSDTSNDDILSSTLDRDDVTVRRRSSNLDVTEQQQRSSSGSYKKCSHSSHSEEETSSFGTDLDGTVRMGMQPKKCTHSSHSEDTSIGLSISEWSTGTNTVRQYANLSGSDSFSAVSNHSGGMKSESKSNHTKSSLSSLNKSTESLDEKSVGSMSSSKMKRGISGGSNGAIKYEQFFSSSDTDKFTESISGTPKSDDTTMTLTEIAQSITEWSTSSSKTLVPSGSHTDTLRNESNSSTATKTESVIRINPQLKQSSSSIEYQPLRQIRAAAFKQSSQDDATSIDTEFDESKVSPPRSSIERPIKIPPRVIDMQEKKPQYIGTFEESSPVGLMPAGKRRSLEMMSKRYQSQDVVSESDQFVEQLYSHDDKFTDRYQSQEFQPSTDAASITKRHSYEDKTLSKGQIREYKKDRHSSSFSDQVLSMSGTQPEQIDEEYPQPSTSAGNKLSAQHSSETSADTTSPQPTRPDKLAKCSPYYSSSLSSESPPIQLIQKPPRKSTFSRLKSPSSGNETDSSVDFRNDPKMRTRGIRKKRQMANVKRGKIPTSPVIEQESSAESSDMSKEHSSFQEYYEEIDDDYYNERRDVQSRYPYASASMRFESLDMSHDNVDEMGFPKYDRLSHITDPLYKPQVAIKPAHLHSPSGSSQPPEKPLRQKKRTTKRDEPCGPMPGPSNASSSSSHEMRSSVRTQKYSQQHHSSSAIQSSQSDAIYYSSEDSSYRKLASKVIIRKSQRSHDESDVEFDTLHDLPESEFDSEYFDTTEMVLPPPEFMGGDESELSDE